MSPARPSSPTRNTLGLMYYSKMIFKYILIFFIWLTPTFLLADPWQIDQDENFITLKKNGEIQHGNNIHFNFDKDNGCKFNVFFFIYTMQDNPSPLKEIFEDPQIYLNFGGQDILASVGFTSPFGLGEIAGIYVATNIPLSKDFIQMNEDMLQDNLMTMTIQKEYAKYFDIPEENWSFENFGDKMHEAHNTCIANQV